MLPGVAVVTRSSRLGAAELTWDPDDRTAILRFVDELGEAGGPEAVQLTGDLDRWLDDGDSTAPFQLLVDCTEIRSIDAAWRQAWADFFIARRDHATVAWFDASPQVALIITMFRKATGVTGQAFATEVEARDYLASARG